MRCRNRNRSSGTRKGDHAVAGNIPSAERLDSTRRTGQGWRINKNGGACSPSLDGAELERRVYRCANPFSTILSHPSLDTHPYLSLAYQSPSQRRLVPWLASMVRGVRALLECHSSSSALRPSSSALRVLTPERSRNHSHRTSHWNHSLLPVIATATPLYARRQQPTIAVVHEKG